MLFAIVYTLSPCYQVPLARSEGHLLEVMESICEKMNEYGERVDSTSNRKTYTRITSRDGKAMDLSDGALDSRVTAKLKFAVSDCSLFPSFLFKKNCTIYLQNVMSSDTIYLCF